MDNQKAIEWLKAISAIQSNSIHKNSLSKRKEALHMAIEALKRQTPKKPVCRAVYTCGTKLPGCPVCLSSIDGSMLYCSKCGQAIDWY